MKSVLLIAVLLLSAVVAMGQARTAERVVDVPFSQLNTGNPPNDSIRYVINGTQGTVPCQGGGTGALAIKVAGVWHCPRLTAGVGTGDVAGPSASSIGEMVVFTDATGKNIGRSNTLSGIPLLTNGAVTALASSGVGNVVRASSATLTAPTLLTPTISSLINVQHDHDDADGGGLLNASNVFSGGTIPPARIISGAIVNARCLRVSNVGQIEVAAADCGTGGAGIPGGVSGNFLFNESGAIGGMANTAYDSVTGRSTFTQKANGNDTINILRFTDTSPTGTLVRLRNAGNSADLFSVAASGAVNVSSTITYALTAAPSIPAAGFTAVWADSGGKNLRAQDDAGNVSGTVRPITCSGTDKISSISSAGVPVCTADQGGAGTGVITLNTLNTSDQNFVAVDDTNIDFTISSAVSTHTFTVAWLGTLAKARQHAATQYIDQNNTITGGAQNYAAATSFTIPSSAGAAPTASGTIAYDTTSNTGEMGVNGTNRVFAFTAGSQTFTDKTLDNSTTASLRDTLFTLQDNSDPTKTANFELGGITSGQNRVVTIANAASNTVIPTTATTNQWVTHIDSTGTQIKAQPGFSNLSGNLSGVQGGTDQTAVAQGDLLYGSAANLWSRLPKDTNATRYLSNTGASNNPAWAQVDLSNGVTGALPFTSLSGSATDAQIPNNITIDLATVASTGDSATAFFSAGTIETARLGSGTANSTTFLRGDGTWQTPAGAGDMVLSGVQSVTGAKTFDPAKLIVGGVSAAPTAVAGAFYRDTDDTKLYWAWDSTNWGEVYVSGLSVLNLASANVTGILPAANILATVTNSRCLRVNGSGVIEVHTADCGSGGGGSPGGSGTELQYRGGVSTFSAVTGSSVSGSDVTLAGSLILSASGAGYVELAEGAAPTVVANRITLTAPVDVPAAGLVYVLPSDTPTNGEQLTANISGTTVTLSWDAAGSGGSGDAVSVNGSAATDANFVATTASGTVPSVTWAIDTGATPDAISIATIGAASATEAGVVTTGTQTFAGVKTLATPTITGAITFQDNVRQTFNPGANAAGLNVGSLAGDPDTPSNGDCWYDSTANELTCRINGANVALGAGGGGGTINSGVTNVIPKYTAATTLDDSLLSDDATTLTYSGSGGLSLTGTGGGYIQFTEGTPPSIVANTVQHAVVADAPAAGIQYLWGATAASGVLRVANSSGVMTVTQDAGISHLATSSSADLAGVLNDEQGSGGGFVRATSPTLTTPALGVATATSINGLTITTSTGTLTIPNGVTATGPATSDTLVGRASTDTLTNKTLDTAGTGNVFTSEHKVFLPAAGCSGTTASSFWDLFTSTPAVAACVTGTVLTKGVLDFADTSGGFTAQTTLQLPSDFTGTIDAKILWTTTATSGNAEFSLATICTATDATELDDPGAFNTASVVATAAPGVANRVQTSSITSLTITGCAANELLHIRLFRDGNDAQDTITATVRFIGLELTLRRQQ